MSTRKPYDDDAPLDGFADVAALARSMRDEDFILDEPPAELWSRIEQRVASPDPGLAPSVPSSPAPAPASLASARRRNDRRGRRLGVRTALAAAAAVVAILTGVTAVVIGRDDEPTEIAVVELSNDGLDPRGRGSHGAVRVVRLDDGTYALDVEVDDLPPGAGGFFELWVIDADVVGMVSLGPLRNGRIPLPAGVDPQAFPVVDISIEPVDGVPTHSGASILRGVIEA